MNRKQEQSSKIGLYYFVRNLFTIPKLFWVFVLALLVIHFYFIEDGQQKKKKKKKMKISCNSKKVHEQKVYYLRFYVK